MRFIFVIREKDGSLFDVLEFEEKYTKKGNLSASASADFKRCLELAAQGFGVEIMPSPSEILNKDSGEQEALPEPEAPAKKGGATVVSYGMFRRLRDIKEELKTFFPLIMVEVRSGTTEEYIRRHQESLSEEGE